MRVQLRKRPAAPPPPPPKAKKQATGKQQQQKEAPPAKGGKKPSTTDAPKEQHPPPSNPTSDPKGGLPDGAGGLSAAAHINTATEANEVAAQAEANAVKESGKKAAKGGKTELPKTGDTIPLDNFAAEIETHEGEKTSLQQLVKESKAGVVLFTYPKASTPGCTTQACLFRDAYDPLTTTGLSIYGLSTDSPKSNSSFKTKQSLPYPLLCDPSAALIGAIGYKKAPRGTTRGVFVVDKSGKVLVSEAGGPKETVEVVRRVVKEMGGDVEAGEGVGKAEERAEEEERS
ncbi:hypothetical protein D0860_08662 [Hortaea werneckii]|uniref:thioredoxin-dependent peroxiredoxin n=1 Tax=Hortaea werneckii TaxID=91943 RepID=A0A3M7G850_HORWE|nr:hypothetical protein D0860_08662 [Hortaea werneckii]